MAPLSHGDQRGHPRKRTWHNIHVFERACCFDEKGRIQGSFKNMESPIIVRLALTPVTAPAVAMRTGAFAPTTRTLHPDLRTYAYDNAAAGHHPSTLTGPLTDESLEDVCPVDLPTLVPTLETWTLTSEACTTGLPAQSSREQSETLYSGGVLRGGGVTSSHGAASHIVTSSMSGHTRRSLFLWRRL